jgi:uncharacterized protein DUF4350
MAMERSGRSFTVFAVLLLSLLSASLHAEAQQVILVDQSHDQRFLVEKDEPLHLSGFAAVMKKEGFTVRTGSKPLSDETLRDVDALVISGPFKEIEQLEVDAVSRFLERGGRVTVMLHIGSPLAQLLRRVDVDFTNFVLGEQENIIDGDPKNFQVKKLADHPLFAGLTHFSLYGGWALMNTSENSRIVASTSPKGWVDFNGDNRLSKGDIVQAFGVVVAGKLGSGRFVVFGDDAIFQNKFLDDSNRQLAINLARWLK